VLKSEGEFTTLGRELELVEAYLSIERARFEHRLRVRIDVTAECRDVRVPSLLIQPLVENAIKHGIAPARAGGEVSITGRIAESAAGRVMTIAVRDAAIDPSRPGKRRGWTRGVGLSSVERRLACHYGANGTLHVRTDIPGCTVVE
jgi:LytS/YehU family sensor histidine kinase